MTWSERNGGKALVVILALLIVVVGVLLVVRVEAGVAPARAGGVRYLEAYGQRICACVPMRDGCYTAKHCVLGTPRSALTVSGVSVPAIGIDPKRDLAHIPLWADPSVVLGVPSGIADWYGQRHGRAEYRRSQDWHREVWGSNGAYVQPQRLDVWCYARDDYPLLNILPLRVGDDVIRYGDSGGGFFVGGKLVGILSLFDPVGCGAWTVRVP